MAYKSMKHSEHRHEIFLVNERNIFSCSRCYELGVNQHYRCTHPISRCNFHLHTACAEAAHPEKHEIRPEIYGGGQYTFEFRTRPVNDDRYCVACGKHIKHYNYHCEQKNIDLHPGCSREFPKEFPMGNVRLQLKERLYGGCQHCNRSYYEGGGEDLNTWAYVSNCRKYQYFAGCIRDAKVRVYTQALTKRNGTTNGHQLHYDKVVGGGEKMVNVVVATVDLFNEVVKAFIGFPR